MKLVARHLVKFGPLAYGGQAVPFGGDTERFETTTEAVVNIGRFGSHGDFVTRLLVKLDTGEIARVSYGDQSPEAAQWMRREFNRWKDMPRTSRECAWGTCWKDNK